MSNINQRCTENVHIYQICQDIFFSWTRIMKSRPYFPPNVKILHSTLFYSRRKNSFQTNVTIFPYLSYENGSLVHHHTQKNVRLNLYQFPKLYARRNTKNEKAAPPLLIVVAYTTHSLCAERMTSEGRRAR